MNGGGKVTQIYDPHVGNITSKSINTGGASFNTTYLYKQGINGTGSTSTKVDSITNGSSTISYTYDPKGRQLQSMNGNGHNISYKYDDSGIRTQKTVDGVTTNYHLVGDQVTYEDNGTDKIYYSYDASGNILSMNLNGTEYYYVKDAQGDIIGLIDGSGTQVVSYTYDTWGKLISIDGTLKDSVGVKNPYRYRGYKYDTETGLYYLQSRYYNPEWGRFINADGMFGTQGELLSHNIFTYCSNNPVSRVDPDGGSWFGAIAIAIGSFTIPAIITYAIVAVAVITVAVIVNVAIQEYRNNHVTHTSSNSSGNTGSKSKTNTGKSKNNTSGLPNQGPVVGNVPGAPTVDAGRQGKHVPGHPNQNTSKSQWPVGETGVDLTQEAWQKGRAIPNNPNTKVWDTGREIGPNGETKINVKYAPSTGSIHGFPTW